MSGATPFLIAGLLLIVLLIFLFLRASVANNALSESSEDESPVAALLQEPLPPEWGSRLFGSQDYDFIAKQGSARLRRLFLQERTGLALSWLQCVRANAGKLIRAHRLAARSSSELAPMVELRVSVNYLFFDIVCRLAALAIWLRGPADLSLLIGYVDALSGRISEVAIRFSTSDLAAENKKREA